MKISQTSLPGEWARRVDRDVRSMNIFKGVDMSRLLTWYDETGMQKSLLMGNPRSFIGEWYDRRLSLSAGTTETCQAFT